MLSKDKFFSLCKGIVGNFCGSLHEEVFKLWVCENQDNYKNAINTPFKYSKKLNKMQKQV